MAFNQTQTMQTYLGQVLVLEHALWFLGQSPGWRITNQNYVYQGTSYTRSVADLSVAGCPDCMTISVTAPGGAKALRTSFRYYMDTPPPFVVKNPNRIALDGTGNVYFTDGNNHSIWKVDTSGDVTRVAGIGTSGFGGNGRVGNACPIQLS